MALSEKRLEPQVQLFTNETLYKRDLSLDWSTKSVNALAITSLTSKRVSLLIKQNEIDNKQTSLQTLRGEELSDRDIEQIADNFREDFGYKLENAWGEYKKCIHDGCKNITSIQDVYSLEPKEYYPLSLLEKELQPIVHCENHIEEGPMVDFWNKETIISDIKKKIRGTHDSVASLLRNNENDIVGYAACYPASFKQAWKNEFEEFHHSLRNNYLEALQDALGYAITEDSPVYVWNLVGITSKFRQPQNTQKLIQSLGNMIDNKYSQLPILCEIDITNPFTSFLMAIGGKILCNGENHTRLKLAIASTDIKSVLLNIDEFYNGNPLLLKKAGYFRSLQKQNLLIQPSTKASLAL